MSDTALAVEARDIRASYGRVLALDNVTFGLPVGSVVAVLGANGAGKSSLLSVLAGQLQPMNGIVKVHGQRIAGLRPWDVARRGVCCVPEGGGIFQELTVRDNLLLAATAARGRSPVDAAFDLFPVLAQRQGQRAGSMSGGEKRMLALSRAVLAEPSVLLVDEPSLGLAPIVVNEVFRALHRLNAERGMSIVVVEQYVERALDLASWAFVLTKGRVTYAGTVDELRGSGALEAAYLGAGREPAASPNGQGSSRPAPSPKSSGRARRRRAAPLRANPVPKGAELQ
jgi:branched-chain amino acid transport system ATP-binding protein